MALFERLGALKTWAKETGTARAALARDKRLEDPLSSGILSDHVVQQTVACYGTPGVVTIAAWDPVQSLLAIGTRNGYIRIFGKGISSTLSIDKPAPIKHLVFQCGHAKLVVIDSKNILTVFDLETQHVSKTLAIRGYVTSAEIVPGSDWLFLGLADGTIDVFDLRVGKIAPYRVPDLMSEWQQFKIDEQRKNGIDVPPRSKNAKVEIVSAIQFHATDLNQMLVAYETGVILWNFKERAAIRAFEIGGNANNRPRVTAISWKPTGESQFVVGYDDGLLCLWDAEREDQPIAYRYILQESHKNQDRVVLNEPIYRLAWCSNVDFSETYLVVAGGTHPGDNHGINVLTFQRESTFRDPVRQSIIPVRSEVADFVILPWTMPYFLGTHDPLGILVLTTSGETCAFKLQQGFEEYLLPSAFSFISPRLLAARQHIQVDDQLFQDLVTAPSDAPRMPYLPLTGGIIGARHVYRLDARDIMISVHEGGIVRVWDSSFVALRPLPYLSLNTFDDMPVAARSDIIAFDFSDRYGSLALAYASGIVLYYTLGQSDESTSATESHNVRMTQKNIAELDKLINDMDGQGYGQSMEEAPSDVTDTMKDKTDASNPFVEDISQRSTSQSQLAEAGEPSKSEQQTIQLQSQEMAPSHDTIEEHPASDMEKINLQDRCRLEVLNRSSSRRGRFELNFMLHTKLNDIAYLAHANDELLAVASKGGHICIVDVIAHTIVYDSILSVKIAGDDDEEVLKNPELSPITSNITMLKFVRSYPPSSEKTTVMQLLIGTSDGSLYQVSCDKKADMPWVALAPKHVCAPIGSNLLDAYIIDLQGQEQTPYFVPMASQETIGSPAVSETTTDSITSLFSPPVEMPEEDTGTTDNGSGFLKRSLTRKQSKKSSPTSPRRTKSVHDSSESPKMSRSRVQKNPHLCILVTETGVQVHLNVSQLKLFAIKVSELFENQSTIVRANLVRRLESVALCCALSNGTLALLSLPQLELIETCSAPSGNIDNVQILQDGRLVISNDAHEVVQTAMLAQPDMRYEQVVKLHDPNRRLPDRPATTGNKSWFAAVKSGLQRENMSLQELDLLVGGQDRPLPASRQKAKQAQTQGNVFHELGNKVNERGERLNELDQKFKEVNQASGDFLKAIKDYNERQAQKKWWEF
ncbi:Lethal(2) giant larvae sro7 [Umbelopsis sp. WA50703]